MTTEEFYAQILETKADFSSLDGLTPADDSVQLILNDFNNNSQVQPWRVWAWLFAKVAGINYEQFLLHVEEVNGLISSANGINTPWLIKKAKAWEFGNTSLVVPDSGDTYYSIPNEAARLVTVASVQRVRGVTLLLVAKGSAGSYLPLTPAELASLRTYIDRIQPPGAAIAVDSRNPDQTAATLKIYFNGTAQSSVVLPLVQAAIRQYLSQLDFAGYLDIQRFNDAIQAVPDVVSLEVDVIKIRKSGLGSSFISFTNERGYPTYAGWTEWSDSDSTITMIPV